LRLTYCVLAFAFSISAFGSGFTRYKIRCTHKSDKDAIQYEVHRFSTSAPGGPATEGLSISKFGKDRGTTVELKYPAESGVAGDESTLSYSQPVYSGDTVATVKSGYIHLLECAPSVGGFCRQVDDGLNAVFL